MLSTLRVKNLALVEDLTLEFQPGLNVISGETGAGKSILIGALSLVLGERADRELIRTGADAGAVEAVFNVRGLTDEVASLLEENGLEPCAGDELLLKRSITTSGSNRQFINGSPATLAVLSRIGEWLVDIHGPHDHQSLLNPGRQLEILDAFGALQAERLEFGQLLRQYQAVCKEKSALIIDDHTYAQQLDLLRFQVREIEGARLCVGEDTVLEQEHQRASNAARLLELAQSALALLGEEEPSALDRLQAVGRLVQDLRRIDATVEPVVELHQQCVALLSELQLQLSSYAEKVDVDPRRLQELDERLNLLHGLRRKYGASLKDVIDFGSEAKKKLEVLEQRDLELERINLRLSRLQAQLRQMGEALGIKRRKVIPGLCKAVAKQLGALGFKQSEFSIAIATALPAADPSATGFDSIDFQFSPNPGETAHPLRSIASSGELARVMLALKTVLAAVDQIPVLVFDEVDANIGGETAHAVGEKMKQIGGKRQVLCITHLPQVAAQGGTHFVVQKVVRGGRTHSEVTLLDAKARVAELARMLGGQSVAATRHAEALLQGRN